MVFMTRQATEKCLEVVRKKNWANYYFKAEKKRTESFAHRSSLSKNAFDDFLTTLAGLCWKGKKSAREAKVY